ncbi:MAG: eukaryotic-like serine/threonine-protein kinase, partial [Acidimicrobiaceae bacterium]
MHELSYLAPEQTESAGATALSDLWSLGATLYFAVEGVPPFDGGSPTATMTAIVTQPPRPAGAAGALGPVLDALLVKEAMDRPEESRVRALLVAVAGDKAPMASEAGGAAARSADAPPEAPALTEETVPPQAPAAGEPVPAPAATSGDERWPAPGPGPGPSGPLSGDAGPSGPLSGDPGPSGPLSGDAGPSGGAVGTAVHEVALEEVAAEEASPAEGSSSPEPWFFQVPAETVEPPPLPEPPPRAPVEVEPDGPPRRFPHGLWAVILAALIAGVMVALIITGGHTLRAQRPTIERSKSVGPVSTWTPYTDSTTGFTIRYPSTWSVRRSGTQTFFVDPAGISYLEIDHQQPPASSLVDSAMQQEKSFSASHPTYRRISIDPTTYQNSPASLWQFTYTDAAIGIRAIDLGVNSPKYGFALYFQARADDWTRAQATFDAFKSVFGIPT